MYVQGGQSLVQKLYTRSQITIFHIIDKFGEFSICKIMRIFF